MMALRFTAVALALASASAETIQWTGIQPDAQWSNPNNWSPNRLPGPNDDAVINYKLGAGAKVAAAVLLTPAIGNGTVSIGSLTVGSDAEKVKVSILVPMSVGRLSIGSNGEVEVNSGDAALQTQDGSVAGTLSFMSGTLSGKYQITGTAHFGDGTPAGGAAKQFRAVSVDVRSTNDVIAGGVFQFLEGSTVTANGGVKAAGQNMAFQVADSSKGNSFSAKGFSWTQ